VSLLQVYFIGDEFQRIYGWRGASADAWSVSVRPYLSATYSLSASFRFGTSVAQLATQLLQFKGELGAVLEGRGPQADILSTAWREGTNPCEVEYQVGGLPLSMLSQPLCVLHAALCLRMRALSMFDASLCRCVCVCVCVS
jgi:hypothetical protein